MHDYTLLVTDTPSEDDVRVLTGGLNRYNDFAFGPMNFRQLVVVARDERGEIVGGLAGNTHWTWLFVAKLWTAEEAQGKGIGTAMLAAAEAEAKKRGCDRASLDTLNEDARRLYEKLGYRVYGELPDYVPCATRWYMWKPLA